MRGMLSSLVPLALLAPLLLEGDRLDAAAKASPPVDAALATAIDLSDSIMRHHEWLQFEGIARAVLDPVFLAEVAGGRHGRIDFAVFTWSSHGRRQTIVPWTMIDGRAGALEVATRLRRAPRPKRFGGGHDPWPPVERRTDLSTAIRFGAALLSATSRRTSRRILNVISNGVDNVAGGEIAARDEAVAGGITINAVALGTDPALASYFRARVVGGAGSFVMQAAEPRTFADVMRAKFLRDLIARPVIGFGTAPGPV